jgi:hypothetical protein
MIGLTRGATDVDYFAWPTLGLIGGRGMLFSKEVENDALASNMDPSRLSCYPWREGDVKQREVRLRWRLLGAF